MHRLRYDRTQPNEASARVGNEDTADVDFPSSLFHEEVPPGIILYPYGTPGEIYDEFKAMEREAEEEIFY